MSSHKHKFSPLHKVLEIDTTETRKIIFSHKRALGDTIMFSAGIRDFKLLFPHILINVISNSPQVFDNNPYLDLSLLKSDPDVEYYQVGYPAIASANNTNIHFSQMFLLDMISITDLYSPLQLSLGEFCSAFANGEVGDPCISRPDKNIASREPFISLAKKYKDFGKNFARQRGDLHLSVPEKAENIVRDVFGFEHYWVIAPGGKRDCTAKIWDWRNFQEVIHHFDGLIKFVVIGKSDLLNEKLNGVIDLTDKFNDNLRGLFSLVYNATGCVSGPSALMHIAAAIPSRFANERKPCVSIFGGREPTGWSWYTNHQILHTNGIFSCCSNGGCWKARVIPLQKDPKHNKSLCNFATDTDGQTIQQCMQVITAKDVIRAIEKYYEGDLYSFSSRNSRIDSKSIQNLPLYATNGLLYNPYIQDEDTSSQNKKEQILSTHTENITTKHTVSDSIPIQDILSSDPLLDKDNWEAIESTPENDIKATLESAKDSFLSSPSKLPKESDRESFLASLPKLERRINLLGNLNSKGGGEQSLCQIASLFMKAGWDVTLFPFSTVHENYRSIGLKISNSNFQNMAESMETGIPLLFYGNDSTHKFAENAQSVVDKSSAVIIGINYVNKPLPTCNWLAKSGKVKAFIFQNEEKRAEFDKEQIGFDKALRIVLFGAIDLNKFLKVCPPQRDKNQPFVILKHCTPDWRKYVTAESEGKGDKIHIWQKHLSKENDIKFYSRLLKEFPEIKFEFMEAHKDLMSAFKKEPRMVFYLWDEIHVEDFLVKGHLYLYRSSNMWRDQYPRVVAEALAAGLPVISEPRDGTRDRIQHGDTGFYATHYDEFALHIKTLIRKENLRHAMGMAAKEWAKKNLDPVRWVEVIVNILK